MAGLEPPLRPMSPITRKSKSFVRRCERCCWNTMVYFPIVVIYALTTWAVWVQVSIGLLPATGAWTDSWVSFISIFLYILLNWSYTTAVLVSPGSPLESNNGYSSLPTEEAARTNSHTLTVKSSGGTRFCKKCNTRKPDRAHHCSTCRRCVLKMDHHCPWLATCVGFRNYKPFLLFLIYTCLFCFICFAASATWVWNEIADPENMATEELMPVNYILLAVISGIIGLVLSAFTGFHLYLASTGKTTIESLERVRYVAPIKQSIQQQLAAQHSSTSSSDFADHPAEAPSFTDQLQLIHANVLPGVTRPEEGEERTSPPPPARKSPSPSPSPSPASASLRRTFADMERSREQARYDNYLDEQDLKKLPNAFDLGWRHNLRHVFGPRLALAWLPVCNTTGDGWHWEVSEKFVAAREKLAKEREARHNGTGAQRGHGQTPGYGPYFNSNGKGKSKSAPPSPTRGLSPSPSRYGKPTRPPNLKRLSTIMSSDDEHDDDGNDHNDDMRQPGDVRNSRFARHAQRQADRASNRTKKNTENWNDIPEDLLVPSARGGGASGNVSHDKGRTRIG